MDFHERTTSLDQLAVLQPGSGTITGMGEPVQVPAMRVTTNLFSMLGYKPVIGRDFAPSEGFKDRVILISHSLWMSMFGGDRSVVGKRLTGDGIAYTIIGVVPADVWLPVSADLFAPWSESDLRGMNRMDRQFAVLAKLKPGVTWKQASAELDSVERHIAATVPRMKDWSAYIVPLQSWVSDRARPGIGKGVFEIVGIVGEVHNAGLDKQPEPTIYVSFRQEPEPQVRYVIRTPEPRGIVRAVKEAVYSVDRDQPVYNIRTMDEIVAGSRRSSRMTLWLLAVFAAVALVLAAVGIYGVVSYTVAQRTNEIGIRMALGAGFGHIIRLVLSSGMKLAGLGVAVGIFGAFAISRLMSSLLFGVSALDPFVFAATASVLVMVALIATLVPARRAARTNPVVSLRYE